MFLITDEYNYNHLIYRRDEFSQLERQVYKPHTIVTDELPHATAQPFSNSYHNEFLFTHLTKGGNNHVLNIIC